MESWRVLLKTVCEKTRLLNGGDFCYSKKKKKQGLLYVVKILKLRVTTNPRLLSVTIM